MSRDRKSELKRITAAEKSSMTIKDAKNKPKTVRTISSYSSGPGTALLRNLNPSWNSQNSTDHKNRLNRAIIDNRRRPSATVCATRVRTIRQRMRASARASSAGGTSPICAVISLAINLIHHPGKRSVDLITKCKSRRNM